MHANVNELLAIKDGETIAISEHVDQCAYCQQALSELKQTQQELRQLTADVPAGAWNNIRNEYYSIQKNQYSRRLLTAIYTLVATVLITGGGIIFMVMEYDAKHSDKDHQLMQLIADSNALENMIIVQFTTDNQPLNHQTSLSIDKLKWRLMMIDQKIQSLSINDIDTKLVLWQDRIRALKAISDGYNALKNNKNEPQIL